MAETVVVTVVVLIVVAVYFWFTILFSSKLLYQRFVSFRTL